MQVRNAKQIIRLNGVLLTGNFLNGSGQDVNKILVFEGTIFLTLEVGERALGRIGVKTLLVFSKPA